jgi:hypothetical protein
MTKKHHGLKAKVLPTLESEEEVHIRDMPRDSTFIKQVAARSYAVQTHKGVIRRNRRDLVQLPKSDKEGQMGGSAGADGRGPPLANSPASRATHSPTTVSAEGRTLPHSPQASHGGPTSKIGAAEGHGPPLTNSPARLPVLDQDTVRPQRSRRPPKYLSAEEYDLTR